MDYEITDGLLFFEQQITVPQLIYLDFDGEQTSYDNDDLDLHFDVKVEASEFSEEDKKYDVQYNFYRRKRISEINE